MDTNITRFLVERRVETVFFPVVVFGYLTTVTNSNIYLILTLIATVTSPIAFQWIIRAFGGIDPTKNDQDTTVSLIRALPLNSPIRLVLLFIFLLPFAILLVIGVPVALYLNFTTSDVVILGLSLFYCIFVVSSQAHRLFTDANGFQSSLSDFE